LKSRVFVSCGQSTTEECRIATDISEMLVLRGFQAYVAKDVQTLFEVDSGIIRELKNSDSYLFVNFRREKVAEGEYRGSLFSNQEFAIAYALGFEPRILVVNQRGIKPEGLLRYICCNTEQFVGHEDCLSVVQRALDCANWDPNYSRRLSTGRLRLSEELIGYHDLTGRFLYLDIRNGRPDIAALEATGRVASYRASGTADRTPCPIRSPLKATGKPGFSHTIFPKSHEAFDLLCFGQSSYLPGVEQVYLNTARDVAGAQHLPLTKGSWVIEYEFCAIGFPLLRVLIEFNWPTFGSVTTDIMAEECF
jgi:hypothetical protein